MRLVALLWLLGAAVSGQAADYYLAAFGNDSNAGSREAPWRSLDRLDGYQFQVGDTIHFRRGDVFRGGFNVPASGITFQAYGQGAMPRLTNPDFDTMFYGSVIRITGNRVVVDGLRFEGTPVLPEDPGNKSDHNVYHTGAVFVAEGSDGVSVRNCDFADTVLAVHVRGSGATVTRNYVHDCGRYLEPPYWGPIAFFVGGPDNEFSYNVIERMIVRGGKFGADGGAFEIDDGINAGGTGKGSAADDVSIHHNLSLGNAGFVEVEGSDYQRLNIHHNYSDDYKWFVSFKGCFDCRVENNTAIRTKPRIGTAGHRFFDFPSGQDYVIRDNVFLVGSGVTTYHDEGARTRIKRREGNRYLCLDGTVEDPVGLPLRGGDRVVGAAELAPVVMSGRVVELESRKNVIQVPIPAGGKGFEYFDVSR